MIRCGTYGQGVNDKMRKYFPIYEEAVSHIWLCNCSILNFLIYEENFIFFFISVPPTQADLIWLASTCYMEQSNTVDSRIGVNSDEGALSMAFC